MEFPLAISLFRIDTCCRFVCVSAAQNVLQSKEQWWQHIVLSVVNQKMNPPHWLKKTHTDSLFPWDLPDPFGFDFVRWWSRRRPSPVVKGGISYAGRAVRCNESRDEREYYEYETKKRKAGFGFEEKKTLMVSSNALPLQITFGLYFNLMQFNSLKYTINEGNTVRELCFCCANRFGLFVRNQ